MEEITYQSSEELQRHNHDVFMSNEAKKVQNGTKTEQDKLKSVLDKYIAKHSSTKSVRALAQENKRTAEYQLDLSADLVEILEKIKNELR